jgi:hypothetical protein
MTTACHNTWQLSTNGRMLANPAGNAIGSHQLEKILSNGG